MRAAGYLRVSTQEQAEHGWNLGADRQKIEATCAERGWEPPVIFDDAALQGDDPERPALLALLARLDDFDIIIMRAQDRISRDPVIWGTVAAAVKRAGVRLETFTGPIDLDTPQGRFVADMMAAVGKLEKGQIGQRVLQSKEARAAAGGHSGGGKRPPFGYCQAGGHGPLLIDRSEAAIVRRIFDLADRGTSQRKVAQLFDREGIPTAQGKRWQQGQIARILGNPLYAGLVRRQVGGKIEERRSPAGKQFRKRVGGTWELHEGQHEAIVDRELFDRVNASRSHRAPALGYAGSGGRPPRGQHLLRRGVLRCSRCGGGMIPSTRPGDEHVQTYVCLTRRNHGPEACSQSSVPRQAVDGALLRELTNRYLDLDGTRQRLAERQTSDLSTAGDVLALAERDQARAEASLARVKADYLAGEITASDWRELRADLDDSLAAAGAAVEQARARVEAVQVAGALTDAEAAMLAHLADLKAAVAGKVDQAPDLAALRTTIGQLIERVDLASCTRPFPLAPSATGVLDFVPPELREGEFIEHEGEGSPVHVDADYWLWITARSDAYDLAAHAPRRATLDVPGSQPTRPKCR